MGVNDAIYRVAKLGGIRITRGLQILMHLKKAGTVSLKLALVQLGKPPTGNSKTKTVAIHVNVTIDIPNKNDLLCFKD